MHKLNKHMSVWLSIESTADILISGARSFLRRIPNAEWHPLGTLFYALSHSRTGFKRSNTVINRLLRAAIQTGALLMSGYYAHIIPNHNLGLFPSIAATLSFTLLLTKPKTLFYDAFGFPISRLYTIVSWKPASPSALVICCSIDVDGYTALSRRTEGDFGSERTRGYRSVANISASKQHTQSLGSLLVNIKTDIHTIQVHELEGGDLSRTKQPQSHLHSNLTPGLSLMIDSEKNSREDFSEKSIDVEAQ